MQTIGLGSTNPDMTGGMARIAVVGVLRRVLGATLMAGVAGLIVLNGGSGPGRFTILTLIISHGVTRGHCLAPFLGG